METASHTQAIGNSIGANSDTVFSMPKQGTESESRSFLSKIMTPLYQFRNIFNSILNINPKIFTFLYKFICFFLTVCSCITGVFFTHNVLRGFTECAICALLLLIQWAKLSGQRNELFQQLVSASDLNQTLRNVDLHFDESALFSHSVSDKVKKLTAEFDSATDNVVVYQFPVFLKRSMNELEDILSHHYEKPICASIKIIAESEECVFSGARGNNNIKSRGGPNRCKSFDKSDIKISDNYAYKAIIEDQIKVFAEGDLSNLHAPFNKEDKFFCEFDKSKDEWSSFFMSTIVMPIRIPKFTHLNQGRHRVKEEFEIYGLLCIDSNTVTEDWSSDNLENFRVYHIIADYADTVASLFKAYAMFCEKTSPKTQDKGV